MRGAVPGLGSPHRLVESLPAIYREPDDPMRPQEVPFLERFLSALDNQLAPIFATLDNLESYFDPRLAPEDFLGWLAGWVGVTLDESWPIERRRALISTAVELYRWRGTVRGLAAEVGLYVQAVPEVVEHGGVTASTTPDTPLPGRPDPSFTVRVRVDRSSFVDQARLRALVASAKPAHLVEEVEVVTA